MTNPEDAGTPAETATWLDEPASIRRVLQVEDNAVDAALAEAMLTTNNVDHYHIERLSRCAEAVARLHDPEAPRPDIILLDLGLPDSRHLQTLEAILAAEAEVPVVVLTVQEDERLGRTAVTAGADDYLSKRDLTVPNLLARTLRYAIARSHRHLEQIQLGTGGWADAQVASIIPSSTSATACVVRPSWPDRIRAVSPDYASIAGSWTER